MPDGLRKGFQKFASKHNFSSGIIDRLDRHTILEGDAFLVFTDEDLVDLLKISNSLRLKIGQNIGIISYDDTPLKEVMAGGITVISTDFKKMGETTAHLITNRLKKKIANPCKLIRRNSL